MKKKLEYIIEVNDTTGPGEEFHYIYKKMAVTIKVGADGFHISYLTGTKKTLPEVWASDTVDDATCKCMLIQLILFGRNPSFFQAVVTDKNEETSQTFTDQRIFGLISSTTAVDLTPIRDIAFITDYIINNVQSKFEAGVAALYAYIYAKSKKKEEDKFTYYWRAFNGLYSSMAKEDSYNGNVSRDLNTEKSMLQNWVYNYESTTDSVIKLFNDELDPSLSYEEVNSKFRHFGYIIRDQIAKASWSHEDVINALAPGNRNVNLANLLGLQDYLSPYNNDHMLVPIGDCSYVAYISLYGFFMTELAYQMRCDYFHARKPILLYSTANNIKSLELVNVLLENYLDINILRAVKNKINLERLLKAGQ